MYGPMKYFENLIAWMPIHKSLSIRENIVTFKALRPTANSPNYLTEMFNFCSNETYNLRSNFFQLSLDKPNTNFLKKSFSYRAAKSWNNLPDNIRQNVDNITVNVAKSMLINPLGLISNISSFLL
jgi:hypothetical protein